MNIKKFIYVSFVLALSCNAIAVLSTAPGFTSTPLYVGSGMSPIIGGLDHDSGHLYFGQGPDLMTLDLSDNSSQSQGTLPLALTNSLVARDSGTTYTSYATTFDAPYPYKMGYIDAGGNYQNQWNQNGIYDIAVNSSGTAYIAADPASGGTKIFEYDLSTGTAVEAASIGGYAGGLAFDSLGNLYYADQGEFGVRDAGVLKYSVDGLGALDMSSYDVVLDVSAGYIGFDEFDNFYATTGWGAAFSTFDLGLGTKIQDIAFGGIGQFVVNSGSIFAIDTDWGAYASTVYEINAIPEPASITMMALGGIALFKRRRS